MNRLALSLWDDGVYPLLDNWASEDINVAASFSGRPAGQLYALSAKASRRVMLDTDFIC